MGAAVEQSHPYARGPRVDYTWSARFLFERPHAFKDVVLQKLGGIVMGYAHPEWPISGVVLGSGGAENRTTLVLALDPSRSFGAPAINRCEEIAAKITDTLGWQRQSESLAEMRIILGRRVGYEGAEYSMKQMRSLVVAHACGDLTMTEADLFSLRHVDGLREYHEPGVILEGAVDSLSASLQLAAAMDQERLVTEITGIETQVWTKPQGM